MIGMPVDQVKRCSVWEFQAALDFWNEAHDTERDKPGNKLSDSEKDEIWAWMQAEGHVSRINGSGTG